MNDRVALSLPLGTRIGPYEIVEWLGAGGMGVVYRARDARLGRDVAIKLIADSVDQHPDRVQRFEREARAAGQLNHPNVLIVHDVGVHDGSPFIVSELLEGESLQSVLHGGALGTHKALELARQIVEGVAALHDKGLVHRDLKPDNLFVTSDGRIKVLDFGIAKLTRPDDERGIGRGAATDTQPDAVLGTAGYMSPEQVRGEVIDSRSDIFSIGAILYEMIVGRPAFVRATSADTIAAVLTEPIGEPPAVTAAPRALSRLIGRCLEKSRESRFQSARDLAFALSDLSETNVASPEKGTAARTWAIALGGAAIVVGLGIAAAFWPDRQVTRPIDDRFAAARFTRFTDWDGVEGSAEISADGRFVAFLADRSGQFAIWLSQLGTGRFTNLTGTTRIPAPSVVLRLYGFSGDGSEIWFSKLGTRRQLVPIAGGPSRVFLTEDGTAASWSPDDTQLAFFRNGDGDPLYVADRTGGNARQIVAPQPAMHNHNPVWSQEGDWIYFVRGPSSGSSFEMDVWRVRPSGEALEQLTYRKTALNFLAPIDARTLLLVARAEDQSGPWLWALDIPTKGLRRLVSGLDRYTSISASRDGRRIVGTVANPSANLWRVPLLDRIAGNADVEPYSLPTARALSPRFSGQSLFYLSGTGQSDGLWRFTGGEAVEVWKGSDGPLFQPPVVSPDGRRVAIVVRRDGAQRLEVIAADGTDARVLAPSMDVRGLATWSPDGLSIAIGGSDAAGAALFKIPVDGGEPIRLVAGEAVNPEWSPDGRLIVYNGPIISGSQPLLAIQPDGTPVKLPPIRTRPGGQRFLPDGTGIVYTYMTDFWLLDLTTKSTRQLTALNVESSTISRRGFDITPDGEAIVFDRTRENSDIVLIELPK